MKRVLVVYPFLHHYRAAVFAAMDDAVGYEFTFVSDVHGFDGIPSLPPEAVRRHVQVATRRFGQIEWQSGLVRVLLTQDFDAVVFLGNVASLSTWVGSAIAHARKRKVYFWTIGWHRPEIGVKRAVRLAFYRLAHVLLLYGNVARGIGEATGFPPDRMRVIGNSVVPSPIGDSEPLALPEAGSGRLWIGAVIRLTQQKRLSLLVDAAAVLRQQGWDVGILLVGEGPMRKSLMDAAAAVGVPLEMPGSAYAASTLARVYSVLSVTVVPSAVGLTAIQSLMHGTPVVSDDDAYSQMPEWEAIIPGKTGERFESESVSSLANAILRALVEVQQDGQGIAHRCRAEFAQRWSPGTHAGRILTVLDEGLKL